jgi:hypothetical protein
MTEEMTVLAPPIAYRKARAAAVLYAIALEGTGLYAVGIAGRGVINAAWFDYGESSIGAYREFSLGIIASRERLRVSTIGHVLRGRTPGIGAWILALPVDSELARSGGIAVYGLPKTRLNLGLDWSPSNLDASLCDQGQNILSMQLTLGLGIPFWVRRLLIYSRLDGQLLATPIATNWLTQIDLVGRPRLTIAAHQHPLGQLAAQLGLESAHPIATVHGKLRHAELPPPTRVEATRR